MRSAQTSLRLTSHDAVRGCPCLPGGVDAVFFVNFHFFLLVFFSSFFPMRHRSWQERRSTSWWRRPCVREDTSRCEPTRLSGARATPHKATLPVPTTAAASPPRQALRLPPAKWRLAEVEANPMRFPVSTFVIDGVPFNQSTSSDQPLSVCRSAVSLLSPAVCLYLRNNVICWYECCYRH